MSNRDFELKLKGYSLTTAEILYRLPDHPSLLQVYVWQEYDLHPWFPELKRFLNFWNTTLEGGLYRVRIAHTKLLTPQDIQYRKNQFSLQ